MFKFNRDLVETSIFFENIGWYYVKKSNTFSLIPDFLCIKLIGVALVNKIIWVSSVEFCKTCLHIAECARPSVWWPLPNTVLVSVWASVCLVYLLLYWIPHMSEIRWSLIFSVWHTSLSMTFSGSIRVVANGSISPFVMAEWCSIAHMRHIFFDHL